MSNAERFCDWVEIRRYEFQMAASDKIDDLPAELQADLEKWLEACVPKVPPAVRPALVALANLVGFERIAREYAAGLEVDDLERLYQIGGPAE